MGFAPVFYLDWLIVLLDLEKIQKPIKDSNPFNTINSKPKLYDHVKGVKPNNSDTYAFFPKYQQNKGTIRLTDTILTALGFRLV